MKKRMFWLVCLIIAFLLVLPMVCGVTLTKPRFGVADTATFNVSVTTTTAATCKWSGIQLAYEFMNAFDETGGTTHKKVDLTLSDPGTVTDFFVNCSLAGVFDAAKLNLSFDLTNPVISTVTASPSPVADEPLETTVTLDASEPVFCKYGLTHLYEGMQAVFGEETTKTSYKTQHTLDLTGLTDNTLYNYAFTCKDLANRTSATKNLSLTVNTTTNPLIEWIKPEAGSYFPTQLVNLSVKTNKKSTCKYGNVSGEITQQAGDFATEKLNHTAQITAAQGQQTYYVKCTFASLETKTSSTDFVVDLTEPIIFLINDSSNSIKPDYSPYLDKLWYAFGAEDNETGIVLYNFSIWKSNEIILNWETTTHSSDWVEDLELTDRETYKFKVKAKNNAGLWSNIDESNGVTINTDVLCDVTCGGDCEPCAAGEACERNADCESKRCVDNVCEGPTCSDKIKNGNESDVDCGGSCTPCAMGKSCNNKADCASGLICVDNKCGLAAHCSNDKKDSDETDIDCGGLECVKCTNGKNCEYSDDCMSERCYLNVCVEKGDIDSDGVKDEADNCPEKKNAAQTDTDNDGIGDVCDDDSDGDGLLDEWEQTHFGALSAKPDEDADNDGLTNKEEHERGTNPVERDSDRDGYSDKDEIDKGYNPLDKKSHPITWIKWIGVIAIIIIVIIVIVMYFRLYSKKTKPKSQPTTAAPEPQPKKVFPKPQIFKKKSDASEKRKELIKAFEEKEEKGNIFERLKKKRLGFRK